ncbi:M20 family metallopeptidase [Actinoplanes friuliensis]|uniref:Acetylornithine deacetylase/Succinyl-diaminopimelate desuccinylase-like protein n=1 Tax=Actinoplanes friuliensis DSM 7358 TaxID=1246995 RepID=U5W476_9ACTN|nr:M20/M25/M40 family metallo-hydrolase [Actinoplanes friuliensis]AGZ42716.1 acetylornithine deacetylase/Succinyl- diaminopimelate desuccinylase-like protein [Actinoplanes friuliensis DSM 7358]
MDLLAKAAELIAVPSTADRPAELHRALDLVLDVVGPGFEVERFSSGGKPSALVRTPGPRPVFRILLNAHLDVVPADTYAVTRDGNRLHGRGAQDMKMAALVLADVFRTLAPTLPYPLGLQLVTDEEVGGYDGTAHQLEAGVRAEFVVIGEQSNLRVVTDSKGLCQVRLHATGTAAHAAYPWLGENALLKLHAAIGALLRRYPVPASEQWTTTVSVARIETSNRAVNQIPADATAWLDIRFPPQDTDFTGRTRHEIVAYLHSLTGLTVELDGLGPPHHADPSHPDVVRLQAAARAQGFSGDLLRKHGAADGRFYYARGINAVIFGPGGDGQHGPDEYVDLTTVTPYRNALITFLKAAR